jgi:hypothetical protein
LRLFRLPERNAHLALSFSQPLTLRAAGDHAVYVRVTQEDGHRAWSSPIYLFR